MIKECKVVSQNDINAVVLFDNTRVQLPSSKIKSDTAFVKYENGRYSIVNKADYVKEKNKKAQSKDIINDDVCETTED